MTFTPPLRIPASYWRGGTSKGVFLRLQDLPASCQVAGAARDRLLLRLMGSPDPYGKQMDGMGGASSSTSKVVIVCASTRPGHDVDYLFAQVAIDSALVDWSGNCGNLSAAVGPFALTSGLLDAHRVPRDGTCTVRIWQANIGQTIVAQVPVANGQVQQAGDFELDGVAFPGAEIGLRFLATAADGIPAPAPPIFPTGQVVDWLDLPGGGQLPASLVNAGIPMVFLRAADLGLSGTETAAGVDGDLALLARLEGLRAQGALRMGLVRSLDEAVRRQHTPKIAWVASPARYQASSGRVVREDEVDLLVRALSMGRLHHAMMGTAAVAIAVAAAVPGTLVNAAVGGGPREGVRFGHPSGSLRVGARVAQRAGAWTMQEASLSRSARLLMDGWVHVPGDAG